MWIIIFNVANSRKFRGATSNVTFFRMTTSIQLCQDAKLRWFALKSYLIFDLITLLEKRIYTFWNLEYKLYYIFIQSLTAGSRNKSTYLQVVKIGWMEIKGVFPSTLPPQNIIFRSLYLGTDLAVYIFACAPPPLNHFTTGFVAKFCQFSMFQFWCWGYQFRRSNSCFF